MSAFTHPVRPADVRELLDLTVLGREDTSSMAQLQYEGIAALYDILCRGDVAYLADEVGMGKTYQAIGLAAILWNDQPTARILFVSPRENLQSKWLSDYRRFFASNYRRTHGYGDDQVASVLFREPVHRGVKHDNLREWTRSLGRREPAAAFVRHTSFSRPVHIRRSDHATEDSFWREALALCRTAGLHHVERPESLSSDGTALAVNLAFADAVNRRLSELSHNRPFYDLVIIDEAQCLRHPDNQTNTVLHHILRGHARKWLFMSATPAHGGVGDIPRVLNHYPDAGEIVDPTLEDDLPALQRRLEALMVRRQRRYSTAVSGSSVGKDGYRLHDADSWKVTKDEMGALPTLAVSLVQKGLVRVLQEGGNRFRIGFLSSFESLSASVSRQRAADDVDDRAEDEQADWHRDAADGSVEEQAPDSELVATIVNDFDGTFGHPLPHPKVDSVVRRIGPAAFGTDETPGGEKLLVFTRRVSTVGTLRDRLTTAHRHRVEARAARVWGRPAIEWAGPAQLNEDSDTTGDADELDAETIDSASLGDDLIRRAMQRDAWLEKYRRTFGTSGRNALFFEDAWLYRLCLVGDVAPTAAAEGIPDELWAESWTAASRVGGTVRYRAERLRYLAMQALLRHPEAFRLTTAQRATWLDAYQRILHRHTERHEPDEAPRRDHELVSHTGLWGAWDTRAPAPCRLPGSNAVTASSEDLMQRQVARSILSQLFRLTDTLVDLWCADEVGGREPARLAETFLGWAMSDDVCAQRLRGDVEQWVANLRMIIDSSLEGAGKDWVTLARQELWPQLFELSPVLGVTGGSGAHQRATQQFRTPTYPRVIVCTDTLKEGVDLHLFCDRVVHYGVAWTAGDQEQRVGRVDRYFSQIERRLRRSAPGEAYLEVGYPHVEPSVERRQIQRVRERQQHAELLMDSPLATSSYESKEMQAGDAPAARPDVKLEPFAPTRTYGSGRLLTRVPTEQSRAIADHYIVWHRAMAHAISRAGLELVPRGPLPEREHELIGDGRGHDLEWTFDAPLARYVVTVTNPLIVEAGDFTGGRRRRLRGRRWTTESFVRILVPTPGEREDATVLERFISTVQGAPPSIAPDARDRWGQALTSVATDGVTWHSEHKATLNVACGNRRHAVTLYAYEGQARIVGRLSSIGQAESFLSRRRDITEADIRAWAEEETAELALGYLDLHPRDGLVYGMRLVHGHVSDLHRLVEEVAWRADAVEAALTGADRY